MEVELVVVRHGRTDWNREVRFRGRMDLPLDEVGLAQAQATAQAIGARWPKAAALYSSPLQRACQTAGPIGAALGQPVQIHTGLLDVDYGAWTGLKPEEAQSRDPELYDLWRHHPAQARFPAGEKLADVQARLQHLLQDLARTHHGNIVVLVGHLVVNRVLLCTLLGLGLEGFWRLDQQPAAINSVCYREGIGTVSLLNDTCHLLEINPEGGTHV